MSTIKDFSFDEAICLLQDLKERPGVEETLRAEGFDSTSIIPAYYDRYLTFLHNPDHPDNANLIREGYNPVHPCDRPVFYYSQPKCKVHAHAQFTVPSDPEAGLFHRQFRAHV